MCKKPNKNAGKTLATPRKRCTMAAGTQFQALTFTRRIVPNVDDQDPDRARHGRKVGTTNKTAAAFMENLADMAIKEARKNGVFVMPGLGRLKKVNRKARMGRNPQTGEPIKIPAKVTAKFYLAKHVKDSIAPKK